MLEHLTPAINFTPQTSHCELHIAHANFTPQIMMDSETFRGIHARLPELGGAVLEATQKLLRNNSSAGPSAQEIVEMFSMPPHAEHTDRECWKPNIVLLFQICFGSGC
jgi:hypothetical protein